MSEERATEQEIKDSYAGTGLTVEVTENAVNVSKEPVVNYELIKQILGNSRKR